MALTLKIADRDEIKVGERELTIGRKDCDVTLADDDEASRRHASIRATQDGAELTDLGSRNGTFVDGRRIEAAVPLTGGETIRIGLTEITVVATPQGGGETVVADSPGGAPTVTGAPPPAPPPAAPAPPPASAHPAPAPPPPSGAAPPRFGAPSAPPPAKRRGPGLWLWLTTGAVILLVAAFAAWFLLIRETSEDQIRDIVQQAATGGSETCDLFTQNYFVTLTEGSGTSAEEFEAACRESGPAPVESAVLSDLEVDGDTASATIESSTDAGDATAEVGFVDQDGWKFDSIEFVDGG